MNINRRSTDDSVSEFMKYVEEKDKEKDKKKHKTEK